MEARRFVRRYRGEQSANQQTQATYRLKALVEEAITSRQPSRTRVEWAADQLRNAEASVADVAASAGFFDQSHFARVFRRHFGVSPSEWRKRA